MNRTVKRTLKITTAIALLGVLLGFALIALLGVGITAFVSWVWGGVRFSPESAIEAVGMHMSEMAYIEADGCRFYYDTVADVYALPTGEGEDRIAEVYPVVKNRIGLWHAVTKPDRRALCLQGTDECVGSLAVIEAKGKYHCFLIPFFERDASDPSVIHADSFPTALACVTVNGNEIGLYKQSYFVADSPVTALEINGVRFSVEG